MIVKHHTMKYLSAFIAFFLISNLATSQGLIADIMDVQSVEAADGTNVKEMQDQYQKDFDELSVKLDESIAKMDEDYKKTVTKNVEDFSKVLAKGEKQPTKNAKMRTYTKINSSTISLRSKKKSFVAKWRSKNFIATQQLPKEERKERQDELKEKVEEYHQLFDEEYNANITAIKAFRDKEHLVDNVPEESTSAEEEQ